MSEHQAKPNLITVSLSIVLLVLALPLLIGATAFVEERIIGTYYVAEACRAIGVFEPLRRLAQIFGSP